MTQLTYNIYQGPAYNGLIGDLRPLEIISKAAEGGNIPLGVVVSRGTSDDQCVLGGTAPLGVTTHTHVLTGDSTGAVEYEETYEVNILKVGAVWVNVQTAGNSGDALFYDNTTGLISVGTAGAGQTQLTARLETTLASAGLGLIRLGAPVA